MDPLPKSVSKRIIPIRGFMGLCHILIEENGQEAVLLDTGLFGEMWMIKLALNKHNISPEKIKAILLTHGHLDHSGNLRILKNLTGATIHAHPEEQGIIDGVFPYKGINAWCGRLENLGRKILGVGKPTPIDVLLEDKMELPYFGGLEVLHLPGHTRGHCGFYSRKYDILFSGDLFASYTMFSHLPPAILNTEPEKILESFQKVWDINPKYIIPQHYDLFDPRLHKERFEDIFYKEVDRRKRKEKCPNLEK